MAENKCHMNSKFMTHFMTPDRKNMLIYLLLCVNVGKTKGNEKSPQTA